MDDSEQLMPSYLRFVAGVIDSADLPLNVSREILQESRDVKFIRDSSSKRVLNMLDDLANSEDEAKLVQYQEFWNEFGQVLKEGTGEDAQNLEKNLLRIYCDLFFYPAHYLHYHSPLLLFLNLLIFLLQEVTKFGIQI
jgi:HSP90 family molecular chaperone